MSKVSRRDIIIGGVLGAALTSPAAKAGLMLSSGDQYIGASAGSVVARQSVIMSAWGAIMINDGTTQLDVVDNGTMTNLR